MASSRGWPGVDDFSFSFDDLSAIGHVEREPDVIVAATLDGGPLDARHGAPWRLVSPSQYGYKSVKHLARLELHQTEPPVGSTEQLRARVAHEERHPRLPHWMLRVSSRCIASLSTRPPESHWAGSGFTVMSGYGGVLDKDVEIIMSTAGTAVPIALLRESFRVLIAHLSETQGETVSVETDYFWSVPKDDLGNAYESPSQLTMGQVTASLDNLREIVADPDTVISYGLVWLGDVLKATGCETTRGAACGVSEWKSYAGVRWPSVG